LDIGANTGFFSIYISKFVKSCDCIEINPFLTKIGREVAHFLKRNVSFYNSDFKDFITVKKYDIAMSYASDEVADRITKGTLDVNRLYFIFLFLKKQGTKIERDFILEISKYLNNRWAKISLKEAISECTFPNAKRILKIFFEKSEI